jgi:hypothetical protein
MKEYESNSLDEQLEVLKSVGEDGRHNEVGEAQEQENEIPGKSVDELLQDYNSLDKKYNIRKGKRSMNALPTRVPRYFSFQKNLSLIQDGLMETTEIQNELNKKYRAESSVLGKIWHVMKTNGYKMFGKDISYATNDQLVGKEMSSLQKILNGIDGIYRQSNSIIEKTRSTLINQLEDKTKVDENLIKYREERVERQHLGKEMYETLKAHTNLEVKKVGELKKNLMSCEHRIKDLDSLISQSHMRSETLGSMINDLNKATDLMIQYRNILNETNTFARSAYERCRLMQPLFQNIDNGAKAAQMVYGEVGRLSDTITLLWSKTFGNIKMLSKIANSSIPQTMYNKEILGTMEEIKQSFDDKKYRTFEEIENKLSSEVNDIEFESFEREE